MVKALWLVAWVLIEPALRIKRGTSLHRFKYVTRHFCEISESLILMATSHLKKWLFINTIFGKSTPLGIIISNSGCRHIMRFD